MSNLDVAVIGGGPAGLATAIAVRLRGMSVAVLDHARPPIDKACGEGIMPDGIEALAGLGVEIRRYGVSFRGIRYIDDDLVAQADFPSTRGRVVRRTDLHRALVARAEEVGVKLRWGSRVKGLLSDGVRTGTGSVAAAWVVGADGLHSQVRRWAGLSGRPARKRRFGVRRHYAVTPWMEHVEVYWARGAEAYVGPVGAREVGVALLWSGARIDFDSLVERFPALQARLEGAAPSSVDRGAGPLEQLPRTVGRGRVALVGDAAGYRDAITGEGLSLAFHCATALAAAIHEGDLGRYTVAYRRLSRRPFAFIRALLFLEQRPLLRRRAVAMLSHEPEIFARLLAIHVRQAPPRSLGVRGVFQMAAGLRQAK